MALALGRPHLPPRRRVAKEQPTMFSHRFLRHGRASSGDHVLPTPAHDRHDRRTGRSCQCFPNRRYTRIGLFLLISFSVAAVVRSVFWEAEEGEYVPLVEDSPENHIFPPLYQAYHEQELRLPQHSQDGRDGKYVFFANHVHGACSCCCVAGVVLTVRPGEASGWGNAMQELLFNSYLAYSAGRQYVAAPRIYGDIYPDPTARSFVFDNYTWNGDGSDYTDYNGKLIPSQIPHTVMMRGAFMFGPPFPELRTTMDHPLPPRRCVGTTAGICLARALMWTIGSACGSVVRRQGQGESYRRCASSIDSLVQVLLLVTLFLRE